MPDGPGTRLGRPPVRRTFVFLNKNGFNSIICRQGRLTMEGRALNALNIARCKNTPNIAHVDWYRVFCIDWTLDTWWREGEEVRGKGGRHPTRACVLNTPTQ